MRKLSLLLLCLSLLSLSSLLADASVLPPNNLSAEDDLKALGPVGDERSFHLVVQDLQTAYTPIVAAHGAKLDIQADWKDPNVNAQASREDNVWILKVAGGLARRKELTSDGFALVLCHEMGHHLGGFPFFNEGEWAAVEGEADYFATQACLRKLWDRKMSDNAKAAADILILSPSGKQLCDNAWRLQSNKNLCYRSLLASLSAANLLSQLDKTRGLPTFYGIVGPNVPITAFQHPLPQCRLDTYASGAACKVVFDASVIPGLNQAEGQQSPQAENAAYHYSCPSIGKGRYTGGRPRCWFKPSI